MSPPLAKRNVKKQSEDVRIHTVTLMCQTSRITLIITEKAQLCFEKVMEPVKEKNDNYTLICCGTVKQEEKEKNICKMKMAG